MDDAVVHRNKSPVRGNKFPEGRKMESENIEDKKRRKESSSDPTDEDEDMHRTERIVEPVQSPTPIAELEPVEATLPLDAGRAQSNDPHVRDPHVRDPEQSQDDHHDADNEESDEESEDESRVERIRDPPGSPTSLPVNVPDTEQQLEGSHGQVEQSVSTGKESSELGDEEEAFHETEDQHAKLNTPPRSPSPVQSPSSQGGRSHC